MSIIIVSFCIIVLILLITQFKVNAFLAFLLICILAGFLLGIDSTKIVGSIQKGIGDMLGSLVIVIVSGAMLGKLVAESGAAERIASGMMRLFGERYIQWALVVTGFVIGIPLFYNVGFVLVMPLVFSVVYRYKLPSIYVGLPILTALSVTHGFLPPHPSPAGLVSQFDADMGKTLLYGILIAIPTVIIAGPIFSKTLRRINAPMLKTFKPSDTPEDQLPGLTNSLISALLPVILLTITTVLTYIIPPYSPLSKTILFLSDPALVLLLSLFIVTFTLGINMKMSMKKIMDIYSDSVKDIAMLLLIMSGAGALKEILIVSGVSMEIAGLLNGLNVHLLVLGWLLASVIRVCLGSATVAGLTAAGIVAPLLNGSGVDPNLMVLSIGAGSLMFSHINDAGFWLFKEYFNTSIRDTIKSWSMMESIVAVSGLVGVLILNYII
ncbi:gluconate:H+ symporter [Chryseosolibacter indicus]|uniref:Gluconate:H+ symporter n=1 Tax=Chryseosolibacter indicus TaxID=2782351 RepID=A0ABS5VTF4_9BACT|nr:gluconate:H+ symporter [Chryseosolibacter indicus]MBT1704710.1 gluconate:H+ symporter [Chryseosolibacter indicus]